MYYVNNEHYMNVRYATERPVRRFAMKVSSSAIPDCGDLMKWRSVQPAGMSAYTNETVASDSFPALEIAPTYSAAHWPTLTIMNWEVARAIGT